MQAEISAAEIEVRQADQVLERVRALEKKRGVHPGPMDERGQCSRHAKAKLVSAQKALAASEAQIGVIDAQKQNVILQISKTELRAPATVWSSPETRRSVGSSPPPGRRYFASPLVPSWNLPPMSPKHRCRECRSNAAEVSLAGSESKSAVRSAASRPKSTGPPASARSAFRSLPGPVPGPDFAGAASKFREQRLSRSIVRTGFTGALTYSPARPGRKVKTVTATLGVRADGFVEVWSGIAEGSEVVLRAGTLLPTATPSRRCAANRAERSGRELEFSAWSIRNPVPPSCSSSRSPRLPAELFEAAGDAHAKRRHTTGLRHGDGSWGRAE